VLEVLLEAPLAVVCAAPPPWEKRNPTAMTMSDSGPRSTGLGQCLVWLLLRLMVRHVVTLKGISRGCLHHELNSHWLPSVLLLIQAVLDCLRNIGVLQLFAFTLRTSVRDALMFKQPSVMFLQEWEQPLRDLRASGDSSAP